MNLEDTSILEKLPVRTLPAWSDKDKRWEQVLVDGDYDGEYFAQYTWRINRLGHVYAFNEYYYETNPKTGEQLTASKRSYTYLSHLVLPEKKGYWRCFKNGNKLDCRSANIVHRTPSMSAALRPLGERKSKKDAVSSSKYRGVSKCVANREDGSLWVSKNRWAVSCRGEYVGTAGSEELAAKMYDQAAKEAWGDKAQLNFPERRE